MTSKQDDVFNRMLRGEIELSDVEEMESSFDENQLAYFDDEMIEYQDLLEEIEEE